MTDWFSTYGRAAKVIANPVVASGRHAFQQDAIPLIVTDVISKLRLCESDHLLEIGCGTGRLLIPLSACVEMATGIDHLGCVGRLAGFSPPPNVTLYAGRWPMRADVGQYDAVLAYSVLHYLDKQDDALGFISAAMDVLKPGGRLLIGDIPNRNAKLRMLGTANGRAASKAYEDRKRSQESQEAKKVFSAMDGKTMEYDDAYLLSLIYAQRALGNDAYLLPQPESLPFSQTRDDVLFARRP